ncbi:hypothetical protein EDB83DRAFT_2552368 [Lactarius deliciosus]|nr:hypothetical protein EDB83DRAFT_2552368 [Lactarius deliciosus]
MSRYQVLENYDYNSPDEAVKEYVAEDVAAIKSAVDAWETFGYYPEDCYEESEAYAGETQAEDMAEQVLADSEEEGDAALEPAKEEEEGDAALEPADKEDEDPARIDMPQMFYGDWALATQFIDSWDQWSSQLSVQFSQFQRCAIFLSLFRDPVDQWAEERLLQIRRWRDKGMTDDDDSLLEDIIGRFIEEFVLCDDAREQYVAVEDPDNLEIGESVDGDDTSDREVPPTPSVCSDNGRALEEEPDEAEEYIDLCTDDEEDRAPSRREELGWHQEDYEEPPAEAREEYATTDNEDRMTTRREEYGQEDEVDEYYYSDDADTPGEAVKQYSGYYTTTDEEAVIGKANVKTEKRVKPKRKTQKKKKAAAPKKRVQRAKSTPISWEKKYISRFGKAALKEAREFGILDYILEGEVEGWNCPIEDRAAEETVQLPSPSPTRIPGWSGPNTFKAAPATPQPEWRQYRGHPEAMDLTAGRMRDRVIAKCHFCHQTGHTQRNCPQKSQPKKSTWIQDWNDEDSTPPAEAREQYAGRPPAEAREQYAKGQDRVTTQREQNAQSRVPTRREEYEGPLQPRGRSRLLKVVHASNVATYAPSGPTTVQLPPSPRRRTPTPAYVPITDAGFKPIHHLSPDNQEESLTNRLNALKIRSTHTAPDTPEEMLADMQIRRARAVLAGNFAAVKDLDFRMGVTHYVAQTMKPTLEKIEGELEHVEARLSHALVSGNAPEIKSLDLAANKLAKQLLKRNVDYRYHTTTDILEQRGRCARKEGNVTIRPSARPERPLGTAVRKAREEIAQEEEEQVKRLVAEHTREPRAKSPDYYRHPNYAKKPQEFWE